MSVRFILLGAAAAVTITGAATAQVVPPTPASARETPVAAAALTAGTSVRDRNGAEIGTVASVDSSGNVKIKTSGGVITVPATALTVSGGIAVSSMSEAQLRSSATAKTQ